MTPNQKNDLAKLLGFAVTVVLVFTLPTQVLRVLGALALGWTAGGLVIKFVDKLFPRQ